MFVKELDGTLASLTKVLPVDGRMLRLVNGPDTAKGTPLATRDNIAAAARAVAEVMDKDEDILILFMTSHGTPGRLRACSCRDGRWSNSRRASSPRFSTAPASGTAS